MSETPKTDSESQKSENPKNPNFGQDLQGTLTWATRDLGTRPHCTSDDRKFLFKILGLPGSRRHGFPGQEAMNDQATMYYKEAI